MAKAKKKSDVRIYTKKTRTWSGHYIEFVHFVGEQEFSPLQRILDLRETTEGWSYPLETLKYAYYNLKSEASPKEKDKDKKYRELCQEVFDFLHPLVKDKIEAYTSLIKDGFIGFDTLWILFQKGLKVMFLDRGVYVGGVVSNVEYQKNFMGEAFIITLQTINVDHEGPVLTTAKVAIPAYSTAKAVETLPVRVIPPEMEAEFAARAKNILEATKSPHYAAYVGEGVHRTWMGPVRFLATGRIMLDAKLFKSRNPNYASLNEDVQDEEDTENFFETNLFTVSPWVRGFSFYAKQWGEFYFDSIKPIAFNDQAFESLVLPETSVVNGLDTKEMIRSLVEQTLTNDYQDIIEGKGGGLIFLLHGSPGTGKAQPLTSMLQTRTGQICMGDVSVGDEVIGENGLPVKVLGVYPQGERSVYKITFADGRVVRADEDHLWKVKQKGQSRARKETHWDIQTTRAIITKMASNRSPFHVPLSQPVEYPAKDIGIDPWLLGLLLGDGHMKNKQLSFSTADKEIVDRVTKVIPDGFTIKKISGSKYDYSITMTIREGNATHGLRDTLKKLGVYGLGSLEKFIPEVCFTMSVEQRLELVRGLMDSDGFASKNKEAIFYSSSEQLIKGFQRLVWSLGGICTIKPKQSMYKNAQGVKVPGHPSWRATVRYRSPSELFSLARKRERVEGPHQYAEGLALKIVSIEPDGVEPTQCILVDSPTHLYLTDNFVVTHNTLTAEAVADLLRRPLYSVSIGELGTDITELERNLRNILEIATSWNAVLLLDEADIFLEARSTHDVVRNALVGVFLRLLEYYQGVLFLTTNRVKNFDSAFHSRISLALCYPEHQADTRKHIWKNLTRFSKLNLSDSDLDKLATYDMNGRQIKNTIRLGLALSKKKEVTLAELEGIIKLTNKFQEAIS